MPKFLGNKQSIFKNKKPKVDNVSSSITGVQSQQDPIEKTPSKKRKAFSSNLRSNFKPAY